MGYEKHGAATNGRSSSTPRLTVRSTLRLRDKSSQLVTSDELSQLTALLRSLIALCFVGWSMVHFTWSSLSAPLAHLGRDQKSHRYSKSTRHRNVIETSSLIPLTFYGRHVVFPPPKVTTPFRRITIPTNHHSCHRIMKPLTESLVLALPLSWCLYSVTTAYLPRRVGRVSGRPRPLASTRLDTEPSTVTFTHVDSKQVRAKEPMPWTINTQKYGKFDHEDWAWAYSTTPDEACSSYECTVDGDETSQLSQTGRVEGLIPKELLGGTFYRVGPGNFERGGRRYNHVLDGDGFTAAFHFVDSERVRYTGRFVETEFFVQERDQDKTLYRNVFGTQREGGIFTNAFDVQLKNTANTNIIQWGGRAFALWEAGRPYELDPKTLEVLDHTEDDIQTDGPFKALGKPGSMRGVSIDQGGPIDEKANLGRVFTAHPHILDNDTLVAFKAAQDMMKKDLVMEFIEFDRDWKEKNSVTYNCPGANAGPHDFSISNDYFCFFQNRFNVNNLPFILGIKSPTQAMQVSLTEPNLLHLVPRRPKDKSDGAIKVEIPSYFTIHNVPKVEERPTENQVVIYSNGWNLDDERFFETSQETVPFLGSWGGRCPDFENGLVPCGLLYRTIVDLSTKELVSHAEVIPGIVMEFPTQDERDDNIIYCGTSSTDNTSLPSTGLCKIDLSCDNAEFWWAEPKIFTGEMSPVPKSDDKGSWLLTILYDASSRRAQLAILDSENFAEGPVCRVHLPHALTYSLHGSFIPSQ